MSLLKRKKNCRTRRLRRVRGNFASRGEKLRISVCRSLANISAQLIDDAAGVTLASCSTIELRDVKGNGVSRAKQVGVELAKRISGLSVDGGFYFDRGRYLYHGRVKALADGLREGGITF